MKWITILALLAGIVICWVPYPAELARLGVSAVMLGTAILQMISHDDKT